jgi:hypothetical protein
VNFRPHAATLLAMDLVTFGVISSKSGNSCQISMSFERNRSNSVSIGSITRITLDSFLMSMPRGGIAISSAFLIRYHCLFRSQKAFCVPDPSIKERG